MTDVTLDGAPLYITEEGLAGPVTNLTMSNVSVTGGVTWLEVDVAGIDNLDVVDSGGGAMVWFRGDFTLSNSSIDGADTGIYLLSGTATVDNVTIQNTKEGISLTSGAVMTVSNSDIFGNDSGIEVTNGSDLHLVDTLVRDNSSLVAGVAGGATIDQQYSSLRCTKTGAAAAGFLRNSGPEGGAVQFSSSASNFGTLISEGCDWGTGADDNAPNDIEMSDGYSHDFGDNASFTCTDAVESLCLF